MCVRNTNQLNRTNENSDRSFRVKVKYSVHNGLFYSRVSMLIVLFRRHTGKQITN